MMDHIAELRAERPVVEFSDWRPGDQPWYVSNIRSVSAALDWTPKVGLRQGLGNLHRWLDQRFGAAPALVREALA
jgi:CDP-paratose 2-epimerase